MGIFQTCLCNRHYLYMHKCESPSYRNSIADSFVRCSYRTERKGKGTEKGKKKKNVACLEAASVFILLQLSLGCKWKIQI